MFLEVLVVRDQIKPNYSTGPSNKIGDLIPGAERNRWHK
jgi:hypothetical protein